MKQYFRLMRVKHYIKNILILLPAVLTQRLFDREVAGRVIAGIVIYSLISSAIYIVNDIRDADSDRRHPVKCSRPVASGAVPLRVAKAMVAVLILTAIILGGGILRPAYEYMLIPSIYFVLNMAYSLKLKHIPLVDVFILMSGYVLRLQYGAVLAGVGVSAWMFLTVTAAAFFLGFGKRRNELLRYGSTGRASLEAYKIGFLDQACLMSMTTAIVFYSLSCADMNTAVAAAGVDLLWSVPVVFVIFLRYLMVLNDGNSGGDPVDVVLKDKCLLALCAGFSAVLVFLLYF